jgi:hypothetical protein
MDYNLVFDWQPSFRNLTGSIWSVAIPLTVLNVQWVGPSPGISRGDHIFTEQVWIRATGAERPESVRLHKVFSSK